MIGAEKNRRRQARKLALRSTSHLPSGNRVRAGGFFVGDALWLAEHEARIAAETERVQKELAQLEGKESQR